ncbi:hypothetical protein [Chitinophaga varians]|uniref:hypothetical protein n=1 Tax=Chitinophaga varians TaxID=2202339 RepID=UPI00165F2350|nr:hypothetical protein [Chitinophaga varians]MBC9914764.1 hypothetical protein [Chitinophaga varians]
MQQEYTYSRAFRIFIFCLVTPFALMPLLAVYGITTAGIKSPVEAFVAFICMVPCGALALYCINELLSVVTSDNNGIRYKSFLYSRELFWEEIKGYQWKEGALVLIPALKGKKKVKVSGQRPGSHKIADWIVARYPDLSDKITNEMVMAAYKADPNYHHKIRMAKYTARAFNIASFVLMVSCFAFIRSSPFTDMLRWLPLLMVAMLAAIPVALEYHKGWLIVSENKRQQTLPGILLAVLFCAAGLFVFGVPVFSLDLKILWTATLVIVIVFASWVVFASRHMKITMGNKIWGVISFLIFFTPAVFGSIVYLNTFFDHSPRQLFETTVYDKRISRGRSTSYYLVVLPWGPVSSKVSISVGKKKYEAAHINDVVTMELHDGALGIPWYTPLLLKR